MSRPLHRPHRISFRVSTEELTAINERRSGVDASSFIRAAALGAPLPATARRRMMSDYDAQKIRQAAYYGNNLNQVARRANQLVRNSPTGGSATLAEILFSLLSLERSFLAFLNTEGKNTEKEAAKCL